MLSVTGMLFAGAGAAVMQGQSQIQEELRRARKGAGLGFWRRRQRWLVVSDVQDKRPAKQNIDIGRTVRVWQEGRGGEPGGLKVKYKEI